MNAIPQFCCNFEKILALSSVCNLCFRFSKLSIKVKQRLLTFINFHAHYHHVSHTVFSDKNWLAIITTELGYFIGFISKIRNRSYSSQFTITWEFTFSAGIFPAWFILFIAPLLEELVWKSYGTDCLRKRYNLFTTSIIFAVFWVLWHFPLSFIKDYYQSNVAETGIIYSINFAVSLIHITAGLFNEIFLTHPDSKVIQTVLLLILSIVIVLKNKDFFIRISK